MHSGRSERRFGWRAGEVKVWLKRPPVGGAEMPEKLKFSDLEIGDRFTFDDPRAASDRFNQQWGPFTKISSRRYRDIGGAMIPIDSIGFFVKKTEE